MRAGSDAGQRGLNCYSRRLFDARLSQAASLLVAIAHDLTKRWSDQPHWHAAIELGCAGGRVLSAFISSLRTADLRRKILFTLGIVILYRVGASMPSPGVNYPNVQKCIEQVSGGDSAQIYSLINLFSGGALLQLSVFAVGVMPYITASIIVQLLDRGDPALRAAAQGGSGRPGQDDAVHALSVGRAGAPAGHRDRGAGRQRRAAAGLHAGHHPGLAASSPWSSSCWC